VTFPAKPEGEVVWLLVNLKQLGDQRLIGKCEVATTKAKVWDSKFGNMEGPDWHASMVPERLQVHNLAFVVQEGGSQAPKHPNFVAPIGFAKSQDETPTAKIELELDLRFAPRISMERRWIVVHVVKGQLTGTIAIVFTDRSGPSLGKTSSWCQQQNR